MGTLTGKTAVVTGSTSGIGLAMARAFAEAGANIVINGMGAQVSHALSDAGIPHTIKTLAVHGEFGQSAYLAKELYDRHGLNTDSMVAAAKKLLGR